MARRGTKALGQTARPLQQDGIELRLQDDLRFLCDAEGNRLWVLNESALALWQLCDGETSLDEMVDAICSLCGISDERARADVDGTLGAFTSAGLLNWSDEA